MPGSQRLGMMQTEEEEKWSVEMEIEAQQYFQPIFERLRREPDDTLVSDLVNRVIPEWGRPLNDNELHAEMMADTFVGGSETSTNAIGYGVKLLIENPGAWRRLKSDPDKYLRTFIEEVLRLESPVQGLFRTAAIDIELHGITIPGGAMINIRYAAGQPRRTGIRVPGGTGPRAEQAGQAPRFRIRHTPLPRRAPRAAGTVLFFQGPGGSHRRDVVRAGQERFHHRAELRAKGAQGTAHRVQAGDLTRRPGHTERASRSTRTRAVQSICIFIPGSAAMPDRVSRFARPPVPLPASP